MSLPSTWTTLTPPEQLFVLTNLERIDRGIAPIEGLAADLNAYAQAGANSRHATRSFPPYATSGGSTYASTSSLGTAMAEWMYDDGPGGTNVGLPRAGRRRLLGPPRTSFRAQYAAPALMGVGNGPATTQLFVGGDTIDAPYFTWAQVTPFLPVGVFPYGVNDSVTPGTSQTSTIQLWASGQYMNISVAQSGGRGCSTLSGTNCNLPSGGPATSR